MSPRARVLAALLLTIPLVSPARAVASEVRVPEASCTIVYSAAEWEEMLALAGVFAANWSAEILRDLPAAREDLTLTRTWHADKTTDELADMPEHIRAAVDRVSVVGARAGYRDGEVLAPVRILVERNDLREDSDPRISFERDEARARLAAERDGRTSTLLSGSREGLSVAAGESWQRAWERTPGAQAESAASRAELSLCAAGTAGSVDRTNAGSRPSEDRRDPAFIISLLEEVRG